MADQSYDDLRARSAELEERLLRLEELYEPVKTPEATEKDPWLGVYLGHLKVTGLYYSSGRLKGVTTICEGPNCTRPGRKQNHCHVTLERIRRDDAPRGCPRCAPPQKGRKAKKGSTSATFGREYRIWLRCRKNGNLCKQWRESFDKFFHDLGPKDPDHEVKLCRRDPTRLHSRSNSYWGNQLQEALRPLWWRGTRFMPLKWYEQFGKPVGMTKKFFEYHTVLRPDPVEDCDILMVLWDEHKDRFSA